jgi:serine/threonine protein kinase
MRARVYSARLPGYLDRGRRRLDAVMSKPSRSPKSPAFPVELVAELDQLCMEREQARGTKDGLGATYREQRIQELQTALLGVPQPKSGSILAGARLERVLEVGGFATVWRATHIDLGEECAVQVFHANCAARGRMLRHFRQGVSALRTLTAAGAPASIVRFYGADDSLLAFATTLVPGSDLSDIARRRWSLDKKLMIFSGVCNAMKFAHDGGILHRDLRPANVLYDEKAEGPVVKDFDLAEAPEQSAWWYAAPERRHGAHERLRESDVYSLGRLLEYLITEQSPEPSTALSSVEPQAAVGDETLARIIARCTCDVPGDRYGDVAELQTEIRRWRSGLGVTATRQSVYPPISIPPRQLTLPAVQDGAAGLPWGRVVGWCVGLALLGGLGFFGWNHRADFGWGATVGPPARVPDAGPAPAPKKKPRPKKRPAREMSVNLSDAVSRLFTDNSTVFDRCHSGTEAPPEELRGRVVTTFKVDAEGVVSGARVQESSIKAAGVARCIAAAHNGLRLYKKPGQPVDAQSRYEIE